jgi:Uma2 family endonuclease
VRGKRIDRNVDPPPDLVIEVDITSSSLDKFSIYAELGVPELWRHDGREFGIYLLGGQGYRKSERSAVFPWLPASRVARGLAEAPASGLRAEARAFREWVREQLEQC